MATDHEIAEAMRVLGGSFVKALSEAFLVADPVNREQLKRAFPEIFAEYNEAVALLAARIAELEARPPAHRKCQVHHTEERA